MCQLQCVDNINSSQSNILFSLLSSSFIVFLPYTNRNVWDAYAKVWSQIMTFFTWIMMGYSLYFQFWNRLVCFLGYVILPGLVLFSSCYIVKGVPLAIALGHWIFLIIFLHTVVISVNLRFNCFVCWVSQFVYLLWCVLFWL